MTTTTGISLSSIALFSLFSLSCVNTATLLHAPALHALTHVVLCLHKAPCSGNGSPCDPPNVTKNGPAASASTVRSAASTRRCDRATLATLGIDGAQKTRTAQTPHSTKPGRGHRETAKAAIHPKCRKDKRNWLNAPLRGTPTSAEFQELPDGRTRSGQLFRE